MGKNLSKQHRSSANGSTKGRDRYNKARSRGPAGRDNRADRSDKYMSCPDVVTSRPAYEEDEDKPVNITLYRSYGNVEEERERAIRERMPEVRIYRRSTSSLPSAVIGSSRSLPRNFGRAATTRDQQRSGLDVPDVNGPDVRSARSERGEDGVDHWAAGRPLCTIPRKDNQTSSSTTTHSYSSVLSDDRSRGTPIRSSISPAIPDMSELRRKLGIFQRDFIQSMKAHFNELPHRLLTSKTSLAIGRTSDIEGVSLQGYLNLHSRLDEDTVSPPIDLNYYAITAPPTLYATVRLARYRLSNNDQLCKQVALELVECVALEASKELIRIYEYQIGLLGEDFSIGILARFAARCVCRYVTDNRLLLNRNTAIEGILLSGEVPCADVEHVMFSVLIDGKEYKWYLIDMFCKPGLRKDYIHIEEEQSEPTIYPWSFCARNVGKCDIGQYGYRSVHMEWDYSSRRYHLWHGDSAYTQEMKVPGDIHQQYIPYRQLFDEKLLKQYLEKHCQESVIKMPLSKYITEVSDNVNIENESLFVCRPRCQLGVIGFHAATFDKVDLMRCSFAPQHKDARIMFCMSCVCFCEFDGVRSDIALVDGKNPPEMSYSTWTTKHPSGDLIKTTQSQHVMLQFAAQDDGERVQMTTGSNGIRKDIKQDILDRMESFTSASGDSLDDTLDTYTLSTFLGQNIVPKTKKNRKKRLRHSTAGTNPSGSGQRVTNRGNIITARCRPQSTSALPQSSLPSGSAQTPRDGGVWQRAEIPSIDEDPPLTSPSRHQVPPPPKPPVVQMPNSAANSPARVNGINNNPESHHRAPPSRSATLQHQHSLNSSSPTRPLSDQGYTNIKPPPPPQRNSSQYVTSAIINNNNETNDYYATHDVRQQQQQPKQQQYNDEYYTYNKQQNISISQAPPATRHAPPTSRHAPPTSLQHLPQHYPVDYKGQINSTSSISSSNPPQKGSAYNPRYKKKGEGVDHCSPPEQSMTYQYHHDVIANYQPKKPPRTFEATEEHKAIILRTNISPSFPLLYGRDHDLEQIYQRLEGEDRLVLITGAVGVGKSALALAAAHQVAKQPSCVAIGLNGHSCNQTVHLAARMSRTLGLRYQTNHPELLCNWLASHSIRILFLLDNIDLPEREDSRLTSFIDMILQSADNVTFLCSSRRNFYYGGDFAATEFHLADQQEAAGEMFNTLLPALPAEAFNRLVRVCNCNPLALKLVASALAEKSVDQDRLEKGLDAIDHNHSASVYVDMDPSKLGDNDQDQREAHVLAFVAKVVAQHLPTHQRELLAVCSLFEAPVDIHLIQKIMKHIGLTCTDQDIENNSFFQWDCTGTRVYIPDVLKYVIRMGVVNIQTLINSFYSVMLRIISDICKDYHHKEPVAALYHFWLHYDTFYGVLSTAIKAIDIATLAGSLTYPTMCVYLHQCLESGDFQLIYSLLKDLVEESVDDSTKGAVLTCLAYNHLDESEYSEARTLGEAACNLQKSNTDPPGKVYLAFSLLCLGRACWKQSTQDRDTALAMVKKSMDMFKNALDLHCSLSMHAYEVYAGMHRDRGSLMRARHYYNIIDFALNGVTEQMPFMQSGYNNRRAIWERMGLYAWAADSARKAASLADQVYSEHPRTADMYMKLCDCLMKTGDTRDSLAHALNALRIRQRVLGRHLDTALSHKAAAYLLLRIGYFQEAVDHGIIALEICREVGAHERYSTDTETIIAQGQYRLKLQASFFVRLDTREQSLAGPQSSSVIPEMLSDTSSKASMMTSAAAAAVQPITSAHASDVDFNLSGSSTQV